jgi:hypothetical protein
MHRSRVDAFRHRAAAIIADREAASHVYPSLTLIGRVQNACRATKVIRHGLWPMF